MFIVISYDIPEDTRRTKLAKLLLNYGQRVQYSVFECILTAEQLKSLNKRMLPLLDLAEDSVRFYSLPRDAVREIMVLGQGSVTVDEPVYIPKGR